MESKESSPRRSDASSELRREDELVDITHIVEEGAASMTLADPFLCNPLTFSLHDAMAASQLADRKMDCCEIPLPLIAPYGTEIADQKDRLIFPRPAPTGLDGTFTPLKWETLTPADSTFVALGILVRLQSLLGGASVGESTFTCLYAHSPVLRDMRDRLFPDPDRSLSQRMERLMTAKVLPPEGTPAQIVVFASALALVETTEIVRSIIQNADIYEEEDFVANTNDIPFYTEGKDVNSLRVLEMALDATKQIPESEADLAEAIGMMLGFQSGFLSTISSMAKLKTKSARSVVEKAKSSSKSTESRLDSLLHRIDRLVSTVGSSQSVQATIHQSFDSYVNRPLVGNAPVRKVFFREPREALLELKTVVSELHWAVCDFVLEGSSLGRLRRILDRVTRSDVNIVSRSHIILNLYFEEKILGQYSLRHLIVQDMKQWTAVPDTYLAHEHAEAFLNRLAKPIYDTLKLRTLNRNRQRAYIEAVMFPEWTSLQSEAHVVDVHLRQENQQDASIQPYFSQYILVIVIRLMDRFVASGMELGLFCSHKEISYTCWYRDFLLSALLSNLTSMKRAKAAKAAESPSNQGAKNQRGKKKKHQRHKSNDGNDLKPTEEDKQDDLELTVLSLKRNLCRGTIRFLAALRQAGILVENTYEFTSVERVFATRFQPFVEIPQPPALTYEHYLEGSDFSGVPPDDLLRTTADWFQSCKKSVEQLLDLATVVNTSFAAIQDDEMRSLLKVCVGNSVYVQRLRQLVQDPKLSEKKITVSFDFSAHHEFCIIKLT